jgi:hypothetical protein
MKGILKNIIFSVGAAFFLYSGQTLVGSSYVIDFLKDNLVVILVAILAINSATLGIVLTKIRELIDKSGAPDLFDATKKEMLWSVKEQIILIGVSLALLMIHQSAWMKGHSTLEPFIEVIVISCFVCGITILYDTAKSVFVIIDYKKS